MSALTPVEVAPLPHDRFRSVLDDDQFADLGALAAQGRQLLAGRVVWCVNSTAHGGGVAEMLRSLLAYTRGAGIDTRWVVIEGRPAFFNLTQATAQPAARQPRGRWPAGRHRTNRVRGGHRGGSG